MRSWSEATRKCEEGPKVTQVTGPVLHGEGLHWDVETQTLFYVDVEGQLVNRYEPATNRVTHAKLRK